MTGTKKAQRRVQKGDNISSSMEYGVWARSLISKDILFAAPFVYMQFYKEGSVFKTESLMEEGWDTLPTPPHPPSLCPMSETIE